MNGLEVRNPGVSALIIETANSRILVDAFNSLNPAEEVRTGDIIVFTHDDGDHFSPQLLPDIRDTDITIVGPPTILGPILELEKADLSQIKVLYSKNNKEPSRYSSKGICIHCFHTDHFNEWGALNNSYLIEFNERKLFITGDSTVSEELLTDLGEVDAIICSLVDEGYLKCQADQRYAIHHLLSYLLTISTRCKTSKIIGVHLLNFERTVDAVQMKKLIEDYGFGHIIIPTDPSQIVII